MNVKALAYTFCPGFLRPTMDRIEASPIGYRLAKGTFWSMAGAVISRGLMMVAAILVARILGKTGYGEKGMIQSTVGLFGAFAGFGLGLTATKHVAQYRESDPEKAGRIISMASLTALFTGGVMALAMFIFAPWLAENTINAPHLAGILRIGSIILLISALNGAQTGALAGFEAFKTIAYVNLFTGIASFPILVLGAWWGGVTGAVWAMAINLGVNWILNHIALRKESRKYSIPLKFRDCSRELPILWKFSLPAVLAGSMVGPVMWLCNAMLVNQPRGYDEMGIYSASLQWQTMLLFIPSLLGRVVMPVLSERFGENDMRQTRKTLILAIKANALIVLPLVLVGSLASPFIMKLYGDEFVGGWPTLVVVLLTTGLLCVQQPVGSIIAASSRMWTGFAMNAGWAVVFIISTMLLVNLGSVGLAGAKGVAYVFHAIWTFGFAYYIISRKEAVVESPETSI